MMLSKLMVVGIVGHMNSGKSTAARWFREKGFHELTFAHAMRNSMKEIGIPRNRENMQRFGSIMRNHWHPDVWVDALDQQVELIKRGFTNYEKVFGFPLHGGIVISDVRMLNELRWIKENRGFTIGLVTDLYTLYKRARTRPDRDPPKTMETFIESLKHLSERHIQQLLEGVDYQIASNHPSPEGLHEVIEKQVWPEIVKHFGWGI